MQGEKLEKGTIKAIQSLRKDGVSVRKAASLLGISKGSVERHATKGTYPVDVTKTKKDHSVMAPPASSPRGAAVAAR